MTLKSAYIGGDVAVLTPKLINDECGLFLETYRADSFSDLGLPTNWVQDNHSRSAKGVLRGLHFQWSPPMSKLKRVARGAAFLVAVDIRKGSPTLRQCVGLEVTADNKKQVYAPHGFAREFCALTDECEVQYKSTGIYKSAAESGIYRKDTEIGIYWPLGDVVLSEKNAKAQSLSQWLDSPLFEYSFHQSK